MRRKLPGNISPHLELGALLGRNTSEGQLEGRKGIIAIYPHQAATHISCDF